MVRVLGGERSCVLFPLLFFFGTTADNALISVGFCDWKHAKVWDTMKSLAEMCGVSVTPPRPQRTHRLPQQLEDSCVVDSVVVTAKETSTDVYRTQVYYGTIDVLLEKTVLTNLICHFSNHWKH